MVKLSVLKYKSPKENFQMVSVVFSEVLLMYIQYVHMDIEVPNVSLLSCSMVTWRSAWLVVEWVYFGLIQLLRRLNY